MSVVLEGLKYLGPDVSYTLTTGLLNVDPIPSGSVAALVNAGIEGFAKAAAIDVPARQRINVVSPALLTESVAQYQGFFHGHASVDAAVVAKAYRKSIFGGRNGHVFKVGWHADQ